MDRNVRRVSGYKDRKLKVDSQGIRKSHSTRHPAPLSPTITMTIPNTTTTHQHLFRSYKSGEEVEKNGVRGKGKGDLHNLDSYCNLPNPWQA